MIIISLRFIFELPDDEYISAVSMHVHLSINVVILLLLLLMETKLCLGKLL